MASPTDNISMALFCDFENVALGVRDAKYEKFDIKPVLERLLLKGSIVVKKAYCDWDRYKGFKATMHEANFELIEIPHVRQSGKNSADIRLVVDALDLCYTKSHVNTFVIISGDSDFSPLVSKLRENAKQVIGVGVKQSTSDLLIANCDEFIFYDDLVRESQRAQARRQPADAPPQARRSPEEERNRKEAQESRRTQGIELAVETFDALVSERGDSGKIWASVLKEAIKRRKPDFSETYYGFRAFGNLLEEAQERGLLEFGRDEKSGAYVFRSHGIGGGAAPVRPEATADRPATSYFRHDAPQSGREPGADSHGPRQRGRGGRSRYASESVPRELPPTVQTSAEDLANDDVPVNEPHRGNDAHHGLHEPVDAPQERPMGSYFRQQPPAAEPPAEMTEPAPPAEPQPAAARGRGRSRKAVSSPVEVVAPPAARQAKTMPQASADAASALPVAAAETDVEQPKKAPARPRRARSKPATDTGAQ
ncbi:NYN domain protein [Acidovorax carolinensis]|uniref:NYN domain protein n=1 Tax=Acidovorax carolinensis TaxID=553814 RepID=A0A240U846_9BURK|nr:NYN domain-containing protein [Acidovorax carolinensis]ART53624.1 NYN domain protein [Acidovorax carolinensis]